MLKIHLIGGGAIYSGGSKFTTKYFDKIFSKIFPEAKIISAIGKASQSAMKSINQEDIKKGMDGLYFIARAAGYFAIDESFKALNKYEVKNIREFVDSDNFKDSEFIEDIKNNPLLDWFMGSAGIALVAGGNESAKDLSKMGLDYLFTLLDSDKKEIFKRTYSGCYDEEKGEFSAEKLLDREIGKFGEKAKEEATKAVMALINNLIPISYNQYIKNDSVDVKGISDAAFTLTLGNVKFNELPPEVQDWLINYYTNTESPKADSDLYPSEEDRFVPSQTDQAYDDIKALYEGRTPTTVADEFKLMQEGGKTIEGKNIESANLYSYKDSFYSVAKISNPDNNKEYEYIVYEYNYEKDTYSMIKYDENKYEQISGKWLNITK